MKAEEIKYWMELANKIIDLHKLIDKSFINPTQNNKEECSQENLKLAIFVGLIDAYRKGKKNRK